jgi:hypothetical protein
MPTQSLHQGNDRLHGGLLFAGVIPSERDALSTWRNEWLSLAAAQFTTSTCMTYVNQLLSAAGIAYTTACSNVLADGIAIARSRV